MTIETFKQIEQQTDIQIERKKKIINANKADKRAYYTYRSKNRKRGKINADLYTLEQFVEKRRFRQINNPDMRSKSSNEEITTRIKHLFMTYSLSPLLVMEAIMKEGNCIYEYTYDSIRSIGNSIKNEAITAFNNRGIGSPFFDDSITCRRNNYFLEQLVDKIA